MLSWRWHRRRAAVDDEVTEVVEELLSTVLHRSVHQCDLSTSAHRDQWSSPTGRRVEASSIQRHSFGKQTLGAQDSRDRKTAAHQAHYKQDASTMQGGWSLIEGMRVVCERRSQGIHCLPIWKVEQLRCIPDEDVVASPETN